jgi:hypothetical protein
MGMRNLTTALLLLTLAACGSGVILPDDVDDVDEAEADAGPPPVASSKIEACPAPAGGKCHGRWP